MIVRKLEEITGTDRDVAWGNGQSRRFLLERDGMGYSLTDTIVNAGSESHLEYKNHLEACYCISGEGEVEYAGKKYPLVPGTMYALDKHEPHVLRAHTTMRLVCVFTPALKGAEAHQLGTGATNHSHY
jgi:L-ectoine synthase